jgi:toxin ParE1/3/4
MRRAGMRRREGLGLAFLAGVDQAVSSATRWPRAGSPIDIEDADAEVRRAPVARFPYYLAYLVADDVIHVLAVAHERRRPQYWTGRGGT